MQSLSEFPAIHFTGFSEKPNLVSAKHHRQKDARNGGCGSQSGTIDDFDAIKSATVAFVMKNAIAEGHGDANPIVVICRQQFSLGGWCATCNA